jgi:hypothetical protein
MLAAGKAQDGSWCFPKTDAGGNESAVESQCTGLYGDAARKMGRMALSLLLCCN